MITFIVHLRVPPANVAAFEALMHDVVEMIRAHEPGVAYYDWAKSADEPDTYVVIEVYRDAEVHAEHMASAWIKESLPKSAALIEGRPRIRQYVSGGSQPVGRIVASE